MKDDIFMQQLHALLYDLDELENSTDAAMYLVRRKEVNALLEPYHFIVTSSRYGEHCVLPVYKKGVEGA